MADIDWDHAVQRLEFLRIYLNRMTQEIAMKNHRPNFAAPAAPEGSRQPWPHHRRFWHRSPSPPPKPPAPPPVAPKPAPEAQSDDSEPAPRLCVATES